MIALSTCEEWVGWGVGAGRGYPRRAPHTSLLTGDRRPSSCLRRVEGEVGGITSSTPQSLAPMVALSYSWDCREVITLLNYA